VRDFVEAAAGCVGIKLEWQGQGAEEMGRIAALEGEAASHLHIGDIIVKVDPLYWRPAEVETLLGDSSKAKRELGWKPKTDFAQLVAEMMQADLNS